MDSDRVSALEQAVSVSEARYLENQTQIKELILAFNQLQQHVLQQQKPPTPKTEKPSLHHSAPVTLNRRGPPPALPNEFDGDRSKGPTFLRSCQTYALLCPESFSDDQTKIIWALSYMKSGRAAKWAARVFKWEEDNGGSPKFLDWDDFKSEFRKEFCPAHSDAAAINKLESTAYYQKSRSVDDYLDEFLDLIAESGYTDPKTLVVKFRRGLDPDIQNAVATMTHGRPSDTTPSAWYEAARNIDQNRASNEAFRAVHRTVAPSPFRPPTFSPSRPLTQVQAQVKPSPGHPVPMDVDWNKRKALSIPPSCRRCGGTHTVLNCPRRFDIRAWTTEELEAEVEERLAKRDVVPPEDCPTFTEEDTTAEGFPQDNE
jgi:hypothetical protein